MPDLKTRPYPPAEPGIVVGPHPSAEANRALGRRVVAGRSAGMALESPVRPHERSARGKPIPNREELEEAVRDGLEARQDLITGNLALAVRWGKLSAERSGREVPDAIGDAMVGLVKAGQKYDPDRYGTVFSTYATWHMRGALSHGDRKDCPTRPFEDGRCIFWGYGLAGGGEGRGRPTEREGPGPDPERDLERDEHREQIAKTLADLMRHLDSREAEVIARRFGLGERQAETLTQVGRYFGVTKERIRQIEAVAMEKLRRLASADPGHGATGEDE